MFKDFSDRLADISNDLLDVKSSINETREEKRLTHMVKKTQKLNESVFDNPGRPSSDSEWECSSCGNFCDDSVKECPNCNNINESTKSGRPRGAPHIENVGYWDMTHESLKYVKADATQARDIADDELKEIMKRGEDYRYSSWWAGYNKYADQVNDISTVLHWRRTHDKLEEGHTWDVIKRDLGPDQNTKVKKLMSKMMDNGISRTEAQKAAEISVYGELRSNFSEEEITEIDRFPGTSIEQDQEVERTENESVLANDLMHSLIPSAIERDKQMYQDLEDRDIEAVVERITDEIYGELKSQYMDDTSMLDYVYDMDVGVHVRNALKESFEESNDLTESTDLKRFKMLAGIK